MKGEEQEGCVTGANGPQREFGGVEGSKDVFTITPSPGC